MLKFYFLSTLLPFREYSKKNLFCGWMELRVILIWWINLLKVTFIIIHRSRSKSTLILKAKLVHPFLLSFSPTLAYTDGNSLLPRPETHHEGVQKLLLIRLESRQALQKQLRHGQGNSSSLADSSSAFLCLFWKYPRLCLLPNSSRNALTTRTDSKIFWWTAPSSKIFSERGEFTSASTFKKNQWPSKNTEPRWESSTELPIAYLQRKSRKW